MVLPSGLTATDASGAEEVLTARSVAVLTRRATSHNSTALVCVAVTRDRPSGVKARLAASPVSGSMPVIVRVDRFHSSTAPTARLVADVATPAATVLPSGLRARLTT